MFINTDVTHFVHTILHMYMTLISLAGLKLDRNTLAVCPIYRRDIGARTCLVYILSRYTYANKYTL